MINYSISTYSKAPKSEALVFNVDQLDYYKGQHEALAKIKKKQLPEEGSYHISTDIASQLSFVIENIDCSKPASAQTYQSLLKDLAKSAVSSVNIHVNDSKAVGIMAQWVEESTFNFDDFKSKKKTSPLKKVCLLVKTLKKNEVEMTKGIHRARAMAVTRKLAETPSNVCTPKYLTKQAEALGKKCKKIEVNILDKKQIKTLKMNSFLSVSQGSNEGAYLISMNYQGKSKKPPIVLVGKGITFDTGGHSLKPAGSMMGMKFDMCGAATVFGVFEYLAQEKPDINVIGLVPTCENIPGGSANKPDDVVTSMSGQTIEILNTDAEGRLILCDALTYAERFKPAYVIDIATLTGACLATFGTVVTGMMGNDQALMDKIDKAGQQSLDRVWQLPLWDEFQKMIDSPVADMANIGSGHGGTITAGCFLSRFTKNYKWAHLDIAGTACQFKGHKRGSTGRPVSLLTQFIDNESQ